MQSTQASGNKTGKVPENPTVKIQKTLYSQLTFFRNNNTLATAKKDLQNMLVLSIHTNELDGKIYSEMAELTFELMGLLETIYANIPGEYDNEEGIKAAC